MPYPWDPSWWGGGVFSVYGGNGGRERRRGKRRRDSEGEGLVGVQSYGLRMINDYDMSIPTLVYISISVGIVSV
jgi:hypothetical protein